MTQTATRLMMVRPAGFGFNPETAGTNAFQQQESADKQDQAVQEFNAFADALEKENISTFIFDDRAILNCPDAVFPNNWITTHHDGRMIIYPMQSLSRRREKRQDIIEQLSDLFCVTSVEDLTSFESEVKFLEGTGSLVFDHLHHKVFMAESQRSHAQVLKKVADLLNYQQVIFQSSGPDHLPVYHTNVLMAIGTHTAILCSDWIPDSLERKFLFQHFEKSSRDLIEISASQAMAFAGNMLEVANRDGHPFTIMSTTAYNSLHKNQIKAIEKHSTPLTVSIPVIEKHGGGSARCMLTEIFLPEKKSRPAVTIREPHSRDEFESYFALRWKVLRQPWNQPPGTERDDQEPTSRHFMAVTDDGKIVGTGRIQFNSESVAQVRYMAVDPDFHGQGIGRKLMETMESYCRQSGRSSIFLQARENAVPFYLSMGYRVVEKTFLLFGEVQHFAMQKEIGVLSS